MLTPLASPPKVIVTYSNGEGLAQANPDAIILDRNAKCLRKAGVRISLRSRRVFDLADTILRALPQTELSREDLQTAIGVDTTHDLSLSIRQVRRCLKPFGIGVATASGRRVVITGPEALPC